VNLLDVSFLASALQYLINEDFPAPVTQSVQVVKSILENEKNINALARSTADIYASLECFSGDNQTNTYLMGDRFDFMFTQEQSDANTSMLRRLGFLQAINQNPQRLYTNLRGINFAGLRVIHAKINAQPQIGYDVEHAQPSLSFTSLTGANFTAALFKHIRMSYIDLGNADFTNAEFEITCIEKSDLRRANFKGANMDVVHLKNCDLRNTNLREARSHGKYFSGSNLTGCDLQGLKFNHGDFTRANLANANLQNSALSGAKFNFANLAYANLSGASYSLFRFRHIGFEQSDFSNAILIGTDFGVIDMSLYHLVIDHAIFFPESLTTTLLETLLNDYFRKYGHTEAMMRFFSLHIHTNFWAMTEAIKDNEARQALRKIYFNHSFYQLFESLCETQKKFYSP
jgi:uncharacterized protein YjbI with pentapeptide repeats